MLLPRLSDKGMHLKKSFEQAPAVVLLKHRHHPQIYIVFYGSQSFSQQCVISVLGRSTSQFLKLYFCKNLKIASAAHVSFNIFKCRGVKQ